MMFNTKVGRMHPQGYGTRRRNREVCGPTKTTQSYRPTRRMRKKVKTYPENKKWDLGVLFSEWILVFDFGIADETRADIVVGQAG